MALKLRYISRLEHALIVGVALLLTLFVYGEVISGLINEYNWTVRHDQTVLARKASGQPLISFSPSGYFVGGFHLVSILVLLAVVLGRKFYAALMLTLAYFLTLLYAHWSRFRDLESALSGWQADLVNLVALIPLLALLIWELTIVFRVVRQTLKSLTLT